MQLKAFVIPVIFLLLGFFWAITSEWAINFLYSYYTSVSPVIIRMLSRLAFVTSTGILLFFLIRRQQQKVENSERQYRSLFFANPNPMWIYQLGTLKIVEANNAAVSKYGYSHKEFLSMSIMDIRANDHGNFIKAIEIGETQVLEKFLWEHNLKSGEQITVSVATHRLTFNGMKCNMIMITDLTPVIESRKQLQEAYRVEKTLNEELDKNLQLIEQGHEESRKMGEVIAKISNLVIIFDSNGTITWVNKAFTEFTGFTLDDCLGQNPEELLTGPDTSTETVNGIKEALSKRSFVATDIVNYKKNGEPFWAELTISSIFDKEGNFEAFISIETVINDRMEKQERLDRQYRAFREIAWTNSHETRRPVATILCIVELLKQTNTETERNEYIALIEQSSKELDDIIRDSALKINNLENEFNPASVLDVNQNISSREL